jgi:hypothetical protein
MYESFAGALTLLVICAAIYGFYKFTKKRKDADETEQGVGGGPGTGSRSQPK